MKIDSRIHLVFPVKRADGSMLFVHSTPIATETYRAYWKPLSLTFADVVGTNLARVGPRVAQLVLQDVSERLGVWDTKDGVKAGLLTAIRQLTNVFVLDKGRWDMLQIEDAAKNGLLDEEDMAEVEGRLIFFTAGSRLFLRETRREMLEGAFQPWKAQIKSLNCTEFGNFLQTSTEAENSGATAVG